MSDVSVLGLGLMGSALARAIQQAGHKITVWNRTIGKIEPFITDGAEGASSVSSAVDASPMIIICVDNYVVTQNFMGKEDVVPCLSGRTLVQLSTGTPRGAQESAAWFKERGADYIDGEILALPEGIGADDTQILLAGHEPAYRQFEPILRCLGGDLRYFGENIRAPSALNLGWLCQRIGMILGALHGVNLCNSENVAADSYASLFPEGDRVHLLARTIDKNDYENPSATVRVWQAVMERIQNQADETEINNKFPDFAAGFLQKAINMGYAEEDISALFKVL